MLTTINKVLAAGTCVICDREGECYEAEFEKLKGDFCFSCMKRLLKSKSAKKEQKKEAKAALGKRSLPRSERANDARQLCGLNAHGTTE